MPNPFAAKTRSREKPRSSPSTPPAPAAPLVEPTRAELDDLRKPELQDLARQRGLDDSGTKAELVERLAQ